MQANNQTAHIPPAARARSQAPDVVEDPSLVRLLFCEILLEEYESSEQPKLNEDEVAAIKADIGRHWLKDKEQRALDEAEFEGRTVKRLYQAMNVAQREQVQRLRDVFENKYKNIADAEDRQKKIDDELLKQVLGETYKRSRRMRKDDDQASHPPPQPDETISAPAMLSDASEVTKRTSGNGDGALDQAPLTPLEVEKLEGKTLRSALCLSGGGIRSATFNLGILQGLARHGLLGRFDYLSTVSGGGFIGGWLSAWIRLAGIGDVVEALSKPPETPLAPDPAPVEHLRVYGNYLSPQPGLFSADTWTLIATFVRNLVLNWLVFVPILIAFLLLPRMWTSIVLRSTHQTDYAIYFSLIVGFLAAVLALSYIARSLPSSNDYTTLEKGQRYKGGQGSFIFSCLIWLVVSSAALAVLLWNCYQPNREPLPWWHYAAFAVGIMIVPLIIFVAKVIRNTQPVEPKEPAKDWVGLVTRLVVAIVLILLVQVIIGYLASALILVTRPILQQHPLAYSILSVPLILLLMSLQALLITGFTSRFSKDDDQEWWARAGAWVLLIAVAWCLVHALVIYGPLLVLSLEDTFRDLWNGGLSKLSWGDVGKLFGMIAGIVSGAVTLLGGFSAKTPANSKEAERSGMGGAALAMGTQLLAPIFLGFVIVLLSLGTNFLLISGPSQSLSYVLTGYDLPYPFSPLTNWHYSLLKLTPFRHLVVFGLLIAAFGIIMGRLISTNVFSLQFMWRNRIIRAYLGASRPHRRPDPFTGFDSLDNLQMHELWPQPGKGDTCGKRSDRPQGDLKPDRYSRKLFHVLNMALNLTGGEKLQWQDRKAESFTVSPLHSGSYWLGYRRSTHYGGKDGISLGASIAISGAFVSPNMGFMMTSAVVRFLMAIFNVRFGWWMGNPGAAGDETNVLERLINVPAKVWKRLRRSGFEVMRPFRLDSPRLSIIPFLSEAVGNIDDKSSYVYLSDGGHFENLGLYEMVLRRCRFIVVSDATTDPDYSFESLATSIRQIRVDLGVPIDIPELTVGVPSQNLKSKYCAMGKIRYSCVDRKPGDENTTDEDFDGILIFIKPSLIGQEPRDVVNYWQGRATFPQEVITDQWFSEAQFESYRTLGSSIIEAICNDKSGRMSLAAFAEKVRDHNQLNFQAFKEEVSFLALESEIRELLQKAPIDSYRSKVRRFIKDVVR